MPSPRGKIRSPGSIRGSVSSDRRVGPCRYGPFRKGAHMLTVNVVVLAGTVAADPVTRRMPSGDEVTELRISVPETGRRLLPLPVVAWHGRSCRGGRDRQGRRGPRARATRPAVLPVRSGRAEPHRGRRHGSSTV